MRDQRCSRCSNTTSFQSSTRTTPSPRTKFALVTTTRSVPWSPTWSTRKLWCCSRTNAVSLPPTRARTRLRNSSRWVAPMTLNTRRWPVELEPVFHAAACSPKFSRRGVRQTPASTPSSPAVTNRTCCNACSKANQSAPCSTHRSRALPNARVGLRITCNCAVV